MKNKRSRSTLRTGRVSPPRHPFMVREITGEYITDTHAILWHLNEDPRLSGVARQIFRSVDQGEVVIYVPMICLVEMVYLSEAGRIALQDFHRIVHLLQRVEEGSVRLAPITLDVVEAMRQVPRKALPELADRLIAATALHRGLPLITKDEALRGWDGITTLW